MNEQEQHLKESSEGLKPLLTSFNEYAWKNWTLQQSKYYCARCILRYLYLKDKSDMFTKTMFQKLLVYVCIHESRVKIWHEQKGLIYHSIITCATMSELQRVHPCGVWTTLI